MFFLHLRPDSFPGRSRKYLTKDDGIAAAVRSRRSGSESTCDTEVASTPDVRLRIHINTEQELINLRTGLQNGVYNDAKSLLFSFTAVPTKDLVHGKALGDVFDALGCLPELKEICFERGSLFPKNVNRLLKKSMLQRLKFHHCTFILGRRSLEKLWSGIQRQRSLEVLEIIDCTCVPYQMIQLYRLRYAPKDMPTIFSFQIPSFLQKQQLPCLRRIVLDSCILDCPEHSGFTNLLEQNDSLEELEIRPVFETGSNRRQQYQAKKKAIQIFLTKTIPKALSSKSGQMIRLKKLVVSLDDYLLQSVYEDAMIHWIELAQNDNSILTDMHLTHCPLALSSRAIDIGGGSGSGFSPDSWLECNLQYYLRVNRLQQSRRILEDDTEGIEDEDVFPDLLLNQTFDISCLRSLLWSSPDSISSSTKSMPDKPMAKQSSFLPRAQSLP